MFKRTAVVVMLFSISGLAAAQQPAAVWPWLPMQIWAVPANAQAMPFPTPFWLWVAPTPVSPPVRPEATAQPVTPPVAAAPTITAPVPAILEKAVPPVAESITVTPAPLVVATEVAKEGAKEVVAEVVNEVAQVPAVAKAPAPIRMAPVAKAKVKPTSKASTQKARKLCFKDGKLDICQ